MELSNYRFCKGLWAFSFFITIICRTVAGGDSAAYIDTHIHLFDHGRFKYKALHPNSTPMQSDFTGQVFLAQTASTPVKYAIAIEAALDWEDELEFLLDEMCQYKFLRGIVAGIPLEDPSFEEKLAKYSAGALDRVLVGIRNYNKGTKPFYTGETLWPALEVLQKKGKVFDIMVRPDELANFTRVAEAFPNLTIVMEHLSVPIVQPDKKQAWLDGLAAMKKYPNVFMKISALLLKEDTDALFKGTTRASKTLPRYTQLKRTVDYVIEVFGVDRCLYGSDWPVSLAGYDNYAEVYKITDRILRNITAADRHKIFYANAVRAYGLDMENDLCWTSGVECLRPTAGYILMVLMILIHAPVCLRLLYS